MVVRLPTLVALLAIAACGPAPTAVDGGLRVVASDPLSSADREAAIAIAQRDRPGGLVTAVFAQPSLAPRRSDVATVLRFDRSSGKTIRTFVDLAAQRVLRRDELVGYPTPLHPDEIAQAVTLARRDFGSIERAFSLPGGSPRYDWSNVVHSIGSRAGHRLVLLRFHSRDLPASVLVDLTTETAVADDD